MFGDSAWLLGSRRHMGKGFTKFAGGQDKAEVGERLGEVA